MAGVTYYSGWETRTWTCSACGWCGPGSDTVQDEMFADFVERQCPSCPDQNLFLLMFPTIDESRANWNQVSDGDKAAVAAREVFLRDVEARMLRTADQLPGIEGDEDIVLVWDCEDWNSGGDTLIRYGERVIWRERAQYEGYRRFGEVAELLKQKYGDRLQDLVPARHSGLFLYGDRITSPNFVKAVREELGLTERQKAMREAQAGETADRDNPPI